VALPVQLCKLVVKQSEHRYRWSLNSQNITVAREPCRSSRASRHVGDATPVITPSIAKDAQAISFWKGAFFSQVIVHRGATLQQAEAQLPAAARVVCDSFVDDEAIDTHELVFGRDSL